MYNNITINIGGIIRKPIPKNFNRLPSRLIKSIRDQENQENFSYTYKNTANSQDAAIYYIAQKDGKVNPISHAHTVKNNPSLLKLRNFQNNNPLKVSYNIDLLINDTTSFDTRA